MHIRHRRGFVWILLLVLAYGFFAPVAPATNAQDTPIADPCDDLRYLMDRNITPFDLDIGGGVLASGILSTSNLAQDTWGDIWAFSVQRPRDNFNNPQDTPITISFSGVDSTLAAEFTVTRGLVPVATTGDRRGYLPLANGTHEFLAEDDGIFIISVRRTTLANPDNTGSYQLQAEFPAGDGVGITPIRNNTLNQEFDADRRQLEGAIEINSLLTEVRAPVGSVASVALPGNTASTVYFGAQSQHRFRVGDWAEELAFLGGDVAAKGSVNGQPRLFYVENYGYAANVESDLLTTFNDSFGTRIDTDWSDVIGVWVTNACTGIRFSDGARFVAHTPATDRNLRFGRYNNDDCADYAISLNALAPDSTPRRYRACFNRNAMPTQAPYDEMTLHNGVYRLYLDVPHTAGPTEVVDPHIRELALQTTSLDLFRAAPENDAPFWSLGLDDAVQVRLDWLNMKRFEYVAATLRMSFLDSPRDTTTRPGANLATFDAFDDVIHIVYKDEGSVPGPQMLLLPAADSYLELITPAGLPAYNPTALPNQPGHAPRALNNRGGDCYPVNTMLEQANCATNGQINPANGNLWYGVTDHLATGYLLDLTLTRSYNSYDYTQDGPFGVGWTTNFLPDYNVTYDPVQNTRRVDASASGYGIALDLTWAPRGIVTFVTPSGSRHAFVSANTRFSGGTLTALTMPGWTLSRSSVRDPWRLRQPDGLIYEFDRAGRLLAYGYPDYNRMVRITYPRTLLDGPGATTGQPVILTDVQDGGALRQIEIYYDATGHIALSVLRDLTRTDAAAVNALIAGLESVPTPAGILCELADNCFATSYSYIPGSTLDGATVYRLTAVTYPDGQEATYQYDELHRLVSHSDARAPVFPAMTYTYASTDTGAIAAASVAGGTTAEPRLWRTLTATQDRGQRRVSVATYALDAQANAAPANTHTYTYDLSGRDLRAAETTFTLIEQTNPLAGTAATDPLTMPETYVWAGGRLNEIRRRNLPTGGGRNTTNLAYDAAGLFASMQRSGYPSFSYALDGAAATLQFGDNTTLQFTRRDARGLPARRIDRFGAVYDYNWDTRGWLIGLSGPDERFTYTYNAVGLVTGITRFGAAAEADTGHLTRYEYNGLGRLTAVHSDELSYTLRYNDRLMPVGDHADCDPATPMEKPAAIRLIEITDTLGVVTQYRFDMRGQLVEVWNGPPDGTYLRRTTYEYDAQGRLCVEYRWLPSAVPLTTHYLYEDVRELPQVDDPTITTVINGYRVTEIDSYGRRQVMTYDALDRIREFVDHFGNRSQFSYIASALRANGLQISQQEYQQGRLIATIDYIYDTQWRMITLRRTVAATGQVFQWEIAPGADNINLRDLTSPYIRASNYAPAPISALPAEVGLNVQDPVSGLDPATELSLAVAYDRLGRVIRLDQPINARDQDESTTSHVAYCALDAGRWQVRRSLPNQNTFDCNSPTDATAITYDAYNRIVAIRDEYGTRRFTYTPDAASHQWQVIVATDNGQWQLIYNAAGDLLRWTDASNITRAYEYDTLGRLRATRIVDTESDYPAAAYTLTYNNAGLLTRIQDGLERGFSYDYNRFGQVTVEQNLNTSDTTTYVYNTGGQLTSIISPTGSVTNYRYDDLVDPTRITGIITPSGAQERFTWDDRNQTITYTDALNRSTIYRMNTLGQLRSISDALGQDHRFNYDNSGNLIAIDLLAGGSQSAQRFRLQYGAGGIEITEAATPDWAWNWDFTPTGALSAVTSPGSDASVSFAYDAFGRVATITAGNGDDWRITRNADGMRVSFPDGTTEAFSFDPLYRLTQDGTHSYRYARASGSLYIEQTATATGARQLYVIAPGNGRQNIPPHIVHYHPGRYTVYNYDADGLLTEIEQQVCMERGAYALPALNSTSLDTPESPCAMLTSASGSTDPVIWHTLTRFVYNEARQLIRAIDSEQNIESFAYDEAGNLITYQNKNGETFTYFYDPLNRLQELVGPTGIRLLLGYNAYNQLTGICQLRVELSTTGAAVTTYEDCAEQDNGAHVLMTYGAYNALGYPQELTYGATGATIALNYADGSLFTGWTTGAQAARLGYSDEGLARLDTLNADPQLAYDGRGQLRAPLPGQLRPLSANPISPGAEESCDWQTDLAAGTGSYSAYTLPIPGGELTHILGANGVIHNVLVGNNGFSLNYAVGDENLIGFLRCGEAGNNHSFFANSLGLATQLNYRSANDLTLGLNYEVTPLGQRLREVIDSSTTRLFVAEADGYVVINALDARGLPLATRVSADGEDNPALDGNLLYIATSAYDDNGQLSEEIIQYRDDTLVNITYRYADVNRLVERIVTITRPLATSSAAGLALMSLLMTWWLARRRRDLLILLVVVFVLGGLPLVEGQTAGDRYVFSYTYDDAGNLRSADQIGAPNCTLTYTYDAANRLTGVTGRGITRSYNYDHYGRVVTIDDQIVVGYADSSAVPLYIGSATIARLPGGPPLFRSGSAGVEWVLLDNRARFVGGSGDTTGAIALLDPLARPVRFDAPAQDTECLTVFAPPPGSQIQPGQGGLMDPDAALYLLDGRAYVPELAHFLQRDPQGPDAFGNFYTYPTPAARPPIARQPDAAPQRGLQLLEAAQQFSRRTTQLTAAAAMRRFAPAPTGNHAAQSARLLQPGEEQRARLGQALGLAYWLPHSYNLRGVQYDSHSGHLWLEQASAPGHSGAPLPDLLGLEQPVWGPALWSPPGHASSQQLFDRLLTQQQLPAWRAVSYAPYHWQRSAISLDQLETVSHPVMGQAYTPAQVWDYLARPLLLEPALFDTVRLSAYIRQLPALRGQDVVSEYLDAGLTTTLPALPPTAADWLATRFTYDITGTARLPGMDWTLLAPSAALGGLDSLFAPPAHAALTTPAQQLFTAPALTGYPPASAR